MLFFLCTVILVANFVFVLISGHALWGLVLGQIAFIILLEVDYDKRTNENIPKVRDAIYIASGLFGTLVGAAGLLAWFVEGEHAIGMFMGIVPMLFCDVLAYIARFAHYFGPLLTHAGQYTRRRLPSCSKCPIPDKIRAEEAIQKWEDAETKVHEIGGLFYFHLPLPKEVSKLVAIYMQSQLRHGSLDKYIRARLDSNFQNASKTAGTFMKECRDAQGD